MSYNHNLERTLAIIGSPSVGKSALSQVFVTRTFPTEYYPTIEKSNFHISLYIKNINKINFFCLSLSIRKF